MSTNQLSYLPSAPPSYQSIMDQADWRGQGTNEGWGTEEQRGHTHEQVGQGRFEHQLCDAGELTLHCA